MELQLQQGRREMNTQAMFQARFHRRLYRVCAALGIEALADRHAMLAHRWREVA